MGIHFPLTLAHTLPGRIYSQGALFIYSRACSWGQWSSPTCDILEGFLQLREQAFPHARVTGLGSRLGLAPSGLSMGCSRPVEASPPDQLGCTALSAHSPPSVCRPERSSLHGFKLGFTEADQALRRFLEEPQPCPCLCWHPSCGRARCDVPSPFSASDLRLGLSQPLGAEDTFLSVCP